MLPLCYIINQQCRIVAGCRSLVVDSRMTAFKIVGIDIFPYRLSSLADVGILGKVCFLVFETAKPSLNHNVVGPATFAIHALTDVVLFEKIYVFVACKLTSLIRVQDNGFRHLKCIFNAFMTILVSRVSSISQPTIQRLYQSITAVRYRNPRLMGM